jgi:hypothetical protein
MYLITNVICHWSSARHNAHRLKLLQSPGSQLVYACRTLAFAAIGRRAFLGSVVARVSGAHGKPAVLCARRTGSRSAICSKTTAMRCCSPPPPYNPHRAAAGYRPFCCWRLNPMPRRKGSATGSWRQPDHRFAAPLPAPCSRTRRTRTHLAALGRRRPADRHRQPPGLSDLLAVRLAKAKAAASPSGIWTWTTFATPTMPLGTRRGIA